MVDEIKDQAKKPISDLSMLLWILQDMGRIKDADELEKILIDLKNWMERK